MSLLKRLSWPEKGLILGAIVLFALIQVLFSSASSNRYRLPNGDIVECSSMLETSKGSYHLSGCDNGSEYYVTGTLEKLRG
jgi:hypothetical protein